jgi:LysR family transcriptional regulator, hydrogen peroxide-inducible genes activator
MLFIFAIDKIYIMNLQQLEYIVALDQHRSFSKAAEVCFVTQATLSTMVKKLEEELNVVLFDRKTTPTLTTDSGREIVDIAKEMVFLGKLLKQTASQINDTIEGKLTLGVIPTVAGNLLHRILPIIQEKYPALELHVFEYTTPTILQKIKSNELDLGILSTPLPNSDLEERILYYEKLKIYGPMHSKPKRYSSPKDLQNESVWLLEEGNCLSDQVINLCALNPKKSAKNFHFKPNTFESLMNMVHHFQGLTLLPELFFLDAPAGRKERFHDFEAPFPVREISMVFHRPYAKLRIIQAIENEIKQAIQPLLSTATLKNSDLLIAKMD